MASLRTFNNEEYETFDLSYTKLAENAALSMITKTLDFSVCPHSHYYYTSSATACKNYVATLVGFTLGRKWIFLARLASI